MISGATAPAYGDYAVRSRPARRLGGRDDDCVADLVALDAVAKARAPARNSRGP